MLLAKKFIYLKEAPPMLLVLPEDAEDNKRNTVT